MIHSYRYIREDIIKTAYAAYITELSDKLLETKESATYLYTQLSNTLVWLNDKTEYIIPIIMYELKLFVKGGFAPIVDRCINCNNTIELYSFSIKEGGLLCKQCTTIDSHSYVISPN